MEYRPFFEVDDDDEEDDESDDSLFMIKKAPRRAETKPHDEENEPEPEPEVEGQLELPIESLSEDERALVEQELVQGLPSVEVESSEPADELAAAAVETFRDKIVYEGVPAEQAYEETLAELEPAAIEAEAAPAAEAPTELPAETEVVWSRPTTAATETAPPAAAAPPPERPRPRRHEASPAATAVTGGLFAYLLGRRRGRLKAERKLAPIQKKLEKEVKKVRADLAEKETKLREAAHQQTEHHTPAVIERVRERLVAETLAKPERPLRVAAPEAFQFHPPQPVPERIGHVVVRAEKELRPVVEQLPEAPIETSAERMAVEHHVETLTKPELLAVSSKIKVDGTSLRQIYETGQVGERGLRRLVSEHLRGHDIKKALKRELLERQIDFERDPAMRGLGAVTPSGASASLDDLLQSVTKQATTEQREQLAVWRANADHQAAQAKRSQSHRRAADITMVATIAVLLAFVIVLLFSRR
jgi:hypothetical protein